MTPTARIYLDHAATSWPKPEPVYAAVDRYLRDLGAPVGRGVYPEAREVERLVADARLRLARLLAVDEPQRIVFTQNGTDSLNLALHGLLRPGDHVVTSVVEHNSVLRPLRHLETTREIRVTRVPCDAAGVVDPDEFARAIGSDTRLFVLIHASNVTGALQPVDAVGRIARQHGLLMLVDAAQSLGHMPVDVRHWQADLVAAPGHKGLLGPLGAGILYIAPGVEDRLSCVRQGGTGTRSEEDVQPDTLPDKYEAGNHNVPAIVGLGAGLTYLEQRGLERVRSHEQRLTARLLEGLKEIPGVTLYGPQDAGRQLGVVSVGVSGYDPQEVALMLDTAYAIQVRPGIHCAPRMHQSLGTIASGGTVRFSLGDFTTPDEIDRAIAAIGEIAGSAS